MSRKMIAILTKDEEVNLPICLGSLEGFSGRVLVVDSGSTDATQEIARSFGADLVSHEFISFAQQRNWVMSEYGDGIDWILFLDADERLTPDTVEEFNSLPPPDHKAGPFGYYIKREFWFLGQPLGHGPYRSNWILRVVHPPRSNVVEQTRAREYTNVDGPVGRFDHPMIHENHRPLSDWVAKHDWYATREALDRRTAKSEPVTEHRLRAFVRRRALVLVPSWLVPFFSFFYRYLLQGGFLDGRIGFIYYVLHDIGYMTLIAAKEMEAELSEEAGEELGKVSPAW